MAQCLAALWAAWRPVETNGDDAKEAGTTTRPDRTPNK